MRRTLGVVLGRFLKLVVSRLATTNSSTSPSCVELAECWRTAPDAEVLGRSGVDGMTGARPPSGVAALFSCMYFDGRGGLTKSDAEALKWYRKAAEQGNAWAQFSLGHMYENGRGVAMNRAEAIRWYTMATNGGNQDAKEALQRLQQ